MTLLRLLAVGVVLGGAVVRAGEYGTLTVGSICDPTRTYECICASGTHWRFTQDRCGRVEPAEAIGTIRMRDQEWCLACVAELFDAAGARARVIEDCHE